MNCMLLGSLCEYFFYILFPGWGIIYGLSIDTKTFVYYNHNTQLPCYQNHEYTAYSKLLAVINVTKITMKYTPPNAIQLTTDKTISLEIHLMYSLP